MTFNKKHPFILLSVVSVVSFWIFRDQFSPFNKETESSGSEAPVAAIGEGGVEARPGNREVVQQSEDAGPGMNEMPSGIRILYSEKLAVSKPAELSLGSIRVLLEELPAGEDTGASYAVYRTTVFQNGAQRKVFVSEMVRRGSASVQLGELDTQNQQPEVVFSGFSGGAHCCQVRSIFFERLGQEEWGQLDTSYDGEFTPALDHSGKGRLVFKGVDDNFLYAFSSYAESWAPIQFMAFENGKLVNVTREPIYRRHLEEQLSRMKKEKPSQREGSNGFWAAYVALHALLGDDKKAWEEMLNGFDQDSLLGLKNCVEYDTKQTCLKEESFPSFPVALRAFLIKSGYLKVEKPVP